MKDEHDDFMPPDASEKPVVDEAGDLKARIKALEADVVKLKAEKVDKTESLPAKP